MSDVETITDLFTDLGKSTDEFDLFFDPDEEIWIALTQDGTRIGVMYESVSQILTFVTELGPMEGRNAEKIQRMLLRLSYLGAQSGGIYAALNAEDQPVLMYRCQAAGIDVPELGDLLTALNEQAAAWAQLLEDAPQDVGGITLPPPLGGIPV
ncbi:MAG: type III secretion system chaperone [Rhodobacteraceae bacterium]|nr:type III secretion system chaperone [Paracoccaceae bacterium]